MNGAAIYERYPHFYDLIHHRYGYRQHAQALTEWLSAQGVRSGARLLEAACGTGNYLTCLHADFEVAGFDLSEPMLAIARQKLPQVHLFKADMQTARIDVPVDVLLCLCSAIAYLPDPAALQRACLAFFQALKPGGVLLIRPWLTPEEARHPRLWMDYVDEPQLKLCRQAVHELDGDTSVLNFHWMVASPSEGVRSFVDQHRLRLFTDEDIRAALQAAGFGGIHRARVDGIATPLWAARSAS